MADLMQCKPCENFVRISENMGKHNLTIEQLDKMRRHCEYCKNRCQEYSSGVMKGSQIFKKEMCGVYGKGEYYAAGQHDRNRRVLEKKAAAIDAYLMSHGQQPHNLRSAPTHKLQFGVRKGVGKKHNCAGITLDGTKCRIKVKAHRRFCRYHTNQK